LTTRTHCHVNLLTPPETGLESPNTSPPTSGALTNIGDGDVTNQSTSKMALISVDGDGALSWDRVRRSPARLAPMNASPSPRPGRKCYCPGYWWSIVGLLLICCWSIVDVLLICCWFIVDLFFCSLVLSWLWSCFASLTFWLCFCFYFVMDWFNCCS